MITCEDKSHFAYINNFNRFMFNTTKNKNKKWFSKSCLQSFSSESVLKRYKDDSLTINGAQRVRLENF